MHDARAVRVSSHRAAQRVHGTFYLEEAHHAVAADEGARNCVRRRIDETAQTAYVVAAVKARRGVLRLAGHIVGRISIAPRALIYKARIRGGGVILEFAEYRSGLANLVGLRESG